MYNEVFDRILGQSAAAQAMRAFGQRSATVDAPVLLLGESGTGKGVLARAIHDASPRTRRAFVAINCAAVPEALFESEFFGHVRGAFTGAQYAHKGLFEQADGGTLFLDEIGELPLASQAKLLTAIEDRLVRRVGGERTSQVDARIIAATAVDLQQAASNGTFRRDLFHRLSVLQFVIPPLRSRPGDVELLVGLFAERFGERYGKSGIRFSAQAIDALASCSWPGNVRELAHAVEVSVLASEGGIAELPVLATSPMTSGVAFHSFALRRPRYSCGVSADDERRRIDSALRNCGGNKTRAAAELGMSRNTLLNKLRRYERSA